MADTTNSPEEMLAQVNTAISSILIGGQSYKIGSRQLNRADLKMLYAMRNDLQALQCNERLCELPSREFTWSQFLDSPRLPFVFGMAQQVRCPYKRTPPGAIGIYT